MYEQVDIAKLSKKIGDITTKAHNEKRALTAQEAGIVAELEEGINELRMHLPAGGPLTLQNGPLGGHISGGGAPLGRRELRPPGSDLSYRALFGGGGGAEWTDKQTGFYEAVFSGRHHPGLVNATMTESVPSDGGFLVPTQQAAQIHAVSLENELVMPRCFVQPMTSNECKIPAMSIGDHSTALMGGFTASYTDELGTISEANPKTRAMLLTAKKLTGLIRFSNELAADIPGSESQITNLCGKGLAWYRDKAFLKGTGAGQPLGILNAPCLIEVEPEGGQGATITYTNLVNMVSRLFAGSFSNSAWIAHQTCIPQLLQLSLPIGTGGSAIQVMTESSGLFKILTRPVVFTEKTEPLGSKGDIMLCDFSQYVVGLRQGMRFDTSIHAHFTTDELLARLIERHDGMPLWSEALTLLDGSTTVSPFVTLAAR
jgi:HK97 family phage major capsid protein